jgi:hypothetical protein
MCESEDLDRFSISARCHAFLHPIALATWGLYIRLAAKFMLPGTFLDVVARRASSFGNLDANSHSVTPQRESGRAVVGPLIAASENEKGCPASSREIPRHKTRKDDSPRAPAKARQRHKVVPTGIS